MMDSQLMGEFECDVKELEADSWSATVDKKFLKLHKKDEVKRQDVIYGKAVDLSPQVRYASVAISYEGPYGTLFRISMHIHI